MRTLAVRLLADFLLRREMTSDLFETRTSYPFLLMSAMHEPIPANPASPSTYSSPRVSSQHQPSSKYTEILLPSGVFPE